MRLNIAALRRALETLEEAIGLYHAEQHRDDIKRALRDSVIQRFEYSYELAWKQMQRWLRENTSPEAADPLSRRDLYRLAARYGLIEDPAAWFAYHHARNISTHTYREEHAEEALAAALRFAGDAESLVRELEHRDA